MSETTFSFQSSLPNLPLPNLEKTIDRYLKSLVPFLDRDEIEEVAELARSFALSQNAEKLQKFLKTRSSSMKNWIEDWWYDAYTTNRDTLLTQNMGSIIPKTCFLSENNNGNQLHVAAQIIHHIMTYWQLIRKEKVEIMKSRGIKWDMSQVYNLFNAARVPDVPKDRIFRHFQTEREGPCPTHLIILCNGHIWKLETLRNGDVKTIEELFCDLEGVQANSKIELEDSIIPLTTLDRDSWYQLRSSIINNSDVNKNHFEIIESAVFSLTLSDDIVENESQLMKYALFGSPINSYCDKNLNIVVLRDGKTCLQAEHANVDAISLFAPCDFAADRLIASSENMIGKELDRKTAPQQLEFKVTGSFSNRIREAENQFSALSSRVHVNVYHYDNFGFSRCKKLKLYADTIIQIALQLAYVKTHKKLAPTYETASTRKFYHGRTETVRSLTIELAKFVNATENGATNDVIRTSFYEAYNTHNQLMEAAKEGKGIDRHFLGLKEAMLSLNRYGKNIDIPLFDHPSYEKSGGNGNFKMSTSFLGYIENGCFGYVTPMCTDGYGAFYRINSERITFTLTNLIDDDTNADEFRENLENSLDYIKNMILNE